MADIKNYIIILCDTLKKKRQVLIEIQKQNEKQSAAIREKGDLSVFDETVAEKERLLKTLGDLDEGFDSVYARSREELIAAKDQLKTELAQMQQLIKEVVALGVKIQTTEQRNKQLVENYFSHTRDKIRLGRKSVKAAKDYYKGMARMQEHISSVYMDKKQ